MSVEQEALATRGSVGEGHGLGASNRKATDMQVKVEDFFRKTRLMLVIDEAHTYGHSTSAVIPVRSGSIG